MFEDLLIIDNKMASLTFESRMPTMPIAKRVTKKAIEDRGDISLHIHISSWFFLLVSLSDQIFDFHMIF